MTWMLLHLGCTQLFDISSTVFVTTNDGLVVDATGVEFCHRLNTNYSSKDIPEYSVEACITSDILDGVANLPNWEGEYLGEVTDIELWLKQNNAENEALLFDTDEDVWCDNVDVDTDMNGNTTTTPFCTSNFEFFLLWSVEIPEVAE